MVSIPFSCCMRMRILYAVNHSTADTVYLTEEIIPIGKDHYNGV